MKPRAVGLFFLLWSTNLCQSCVRKKIKWKHPTAAPHTTSLTSLKTLAHSSFINTNKSFTILQNGYLPIQLVFLQLPMYFILERALKQLRLKGWIFPLSHVSLVNNFCRFCISTFRLMSSWLFAADLGIWLPVEPGRRGACVRRPTMLSCLFRRQPGLANKETMTGRASSGKV